MITFKFVYFNPESDILQQSVIGFVGDEDTESVVRRDGSDEGGERSLQKNLKKLGENPNKKKKNLYFYPCATSNPTLSLLCRTHENYKTLETIGGVLFNTIMKHLASHALYLFRWRTC